MADVPFQDDLSIGNDERLLRRVPAQWVVPDGEGGLRPASAVFKHSEMSVYLEGLLREQGREPRDVLATYPGQFLTSITAGLARSLSQVVVKDTRPPSDPAHGLVIGKKTDSIANRMVRASIWAVPPARLHGAGFPAG